MRAPKLTANRNFPWKKRIGHFLQFFRKTSFAPRIHYITRAECENHPNMYADIFNEREDGIIVTDFMSREEVDRFLVNLNSCTEKYPELVEIIDNGYTFGKTFFDVPDQEVYKSLVPRYEAIELELFGFSFKNRLLEVLKQLSPTVKVQVATLQDGTPFLSNTIRVLSPGLGGLYYHSDLNIHESAPEAQLIMEQIDPFNLLSFFVMLQQPEIGGRLLLFDALYRQTPASVFSPGADKFDRIRAFIEQLPVHAINVNPGSLILFNAGTRWHAIEPVSGQRPRITAGCFHGYNANHSTILIWS